MGQQMIRRTPEHVESKIMLDWLSILYGLVAPNMSERFYFARSDTRIKITLKCRERWAGNGVAFDVFGAGWERLGS